VNRPFVYVNMATTVDGKITSAGREYPRFTSRFDRETMDRLRAEADALMVGAGTVRADDPSLHVRSASMREYRRKLGRPEALTRILVSRSLNLDLSSRFFGDDGAERIVATVEQAPADRLAAVEQVASVWQVGKERVDLPRLLELLERGGVGRLLVEGGAELNWTLLADDLIDELYVTIAPCLLGGREAPTLLEGTGLPMARQRRLKLLDVQREGDELYTRWAVVRR
jgi:2,5-diamino-6-(ribosylamino)-4(3H)-pyrimidinone 5'-phosphate reductase